MRYPGGKGKTYQHLINLMPPHAVYIETHLGGGAVLRHKQPAARNIAIERNEQIINYWRGQGACSVELVHGRAEEFLASFPFSGNELIYCDPPYMGSTRMRQRVYRYDYSDTDHEQLLALLTDLPCNVMISGYTSELYGEKLANWNVYSFLAMTQIGLREEKVWFNFNPPTKLHDTRYIGSTFRDRQSIKRRFERLKTKIACMDPIERDALFTWMWQTYPLLSKED